MELTNFNEDVLQSELPVLVDFYADWCGPCKMVAPILAELAEAHSDKIKVVKVNVDIHTELAHQYRVVSIPTMIVFENGQMKESFVGYHTLEELEELLGL